MATITQGAIDKLLKPRQDRLNEQEVSSDDEVNLRVAEGSLEPGAANRVRLAKRQILDRRYQRTVPSANQIRDQYASQKGISITPLVTEKDITILPESMQHSMGHPARSQLVADAKTRADQSGKPWTYMDDIKAARAQGGYPPAGAMQQYNQEKQGAYQSELDRLEQARNQKPSDLLSDMYRGSPTAPHTARSLRHAQYAASMKFDGPMRNTFYRLAPDAREKIMKLPKDAALEVLRQSGSERIPKLDEIDHLYEPDSTGDNMGNGEIPSFSSKPSKDARVIAPPTQ